MSRVAVGLDLPGASVADAEALWYDRDRWAGFVEGLQRIEETAGPYPQAGATTVWVSFPAGRGRVSEEVVAYTPGAGQEVAVCDPEMTARQRVTFAALEGAEPGVRVTLELDYRLRRGGPLSGLTDLLFIRRAQTDALRRTLLRFRAELGEDPGAGGGALA